MVRISFSPAGGLLLRSDFGVGMASTCCERGFARFVHCRRRVDAGGLGRDDDGLGLLVLLLLGGPVVEGVELREMVPVVGRLRVLSQSAAWHREAVKKASFGTLSHPSANHWATTARACSFLLTERIVDDEEQAEQQLPRDDGVATRQGRGSHPCDRGRWVQTALSQNG
eukprot:6791864-Lingulodinium_polyedra.AAC.1